MPGTSHSIRDRFDKRNAAPWRGVVGSLTALLLTTLSTSASAAPDHPTWKPFGDPVACERQGVTFQVSKRVGLDDYRLTAEFSDITYYETTVVVMDHPLPYDHVLSYQHITNLSPSDDTVFCDEEGFPISRLDGIWEVTESNYDKLGGYIELGASPPIPIDYHTLAVIWNNHQTDPNNTVAVGCQCEIPFFEDSGTEADAEEGVFAHGDWNGWDTYDPYHGLGPLIDLLHNIGHLLFAIDNNGGATPVDILDLAAKKLQHGAGAVIALNIDKGALGQEWTPGLQRQHFDGLEIMYLGHGPRTFQDWLAASFARGECVDTKQTFAGMTGDLLSLRTVRTTGAHVLELVQATKGVPSRAKKPRIPGTPNAMSRCDLWSLLQRAVDGRHKDKTPFRLVVAGK